MTDNKNPKPPQPPPNPTTTITIVVDHATQSLQLTGPIENQMWLLGVLEQAKQVVVSYNQSNQRTRRQNIVVPKFTPKM